MSIVVHRIRFFMASLKLTASWLLVKINQLGSCLRADEISERAADRQPHPGVLEAIFSKAHYQFAYARAKPVDHWML
jgi:hypothetical protein